MSIGAQQIDPFREAQELGTERGNAPAVQASPAPSRPAPESWSAEAPGMALIEALALAQRSAESLTGRPVDAVVNSERNPEGGWTIDIDVLEAKAKMGTNDLLCCYRIGLGADGGLIGYSRLRRYHREDG